MIIERNIANKFKHFEGKLVFIFGPRQSGKTFFIENKLEPNLSLNMDVAKDRVAFKNLYDFITEWYKNNAGNFKTKPLVFIDEIHKVKGWRDIIKGTFDKTHNFINYVATGSSAFGLRKQDKGDSLAGRAIWLHLFPVSFREYVTSLANDITLTDPWHCEGSLVEHARQNVRHGIKLRELWNDYIKFGSFAENLMRKEKKFYPMDYCFTSYKEATVDGARFECIAACLLKRG